MNAPLVSYQSLATALPALVDRAAAVLANARGAAVPTGLSARLAAHVVAVTDAIYESARTGQKLRIETP